MNNDIFPCLWCDGTAQASAVFYTDIFNGKITLDTPGVIMLEIFHQKMMLLNAGPQFVKNPSISFMVICDREEEVVEYWEKLSDGGTALMSLDEYPWSKKYGWIQDKFGVSWQLYTGKTPQNNQRVVPTLMFVGEHNGKALQAMEFYTRIFPDSAINGILKYKDGGGHDVPENVQHAQFTLDDYTWYCMDSSFDHKFQFNEAVSMVVLTDDQTETDYLWEKLISNGGNESRCGWLKDQFGVSWQIVPKRLVELLNHPDLDKAQKAVHAMLQMTKIIIADLE